jgi:hypothetical protein
MTSRSGASAWGQGVSKLGVSCGFRMALGAIKDLKGRAQLVTDSLQVLANVHRVSRRVARGDLHGAATRTTRTLSARCWRGANPSPTRARCGADAP